MSNQRRNADFRQAVDIEDAARAINQINRRIKLEKHINSADAILEREKAKVTLSPTLDAWLKKEIP